MYCAVASSAMQKSIKYMVCEYNLKPENIRSMKFHKKYGLSQVGAQETENGYKTASLQLKKLIVYHS